MSSTRDAGFWLLFAAAVVTLILMTVVSVVVLYETSASGPAWNHLVLLGIFAALLGLMVLVVLKARQPD